MDELGPDWILDSYGRFGFNMMARDVAFSERWHDDHDDVRRADLELVQDPVRRLSFEGIRALGEALAGEPLAALQTARGVRVLADVANMSILRDELRLAEIVARREIGDGDGLLDELEALTGSDVAPTTYVRVRALAELVAFHLDNDAIESAGRRSTGCRNWSSPRFGFGCTVAGRPVRADVALATDYVDDADRWVDEIDDPFWQPVGRDAVLLRRDDETVRSTPWTTPSRDAADTTSSSRCCEPWRTRARGSAQARHRRGRDGGRPRDGQDDRRPGPRCRRTRRTLRLAGTRRMARSCASGLGE